MQGLCLECGQKIVTEYEIVEAGTLELDRCESGKCGKHKNGILAVRIQTNDFNAIEHELPIESNVLFFRLYSNDGCIGYAKVTNSIEALYLCYLVSLGFLAFECGFKGIKHEDEYIRMVKKYG